MFSVLMQQQMTIIFLPKIQLVATLQIVKVEVYVREVRKSFRNC